VDENGAAIDKPIENITLYGSFNVKDPNMNVNDYNERNPTKLLIREPFKEKEKIFA